MEAPLVSRARPLCRRRTGLPGARRVARVLGLAASLAAGALALAPVRASAQDDAASADAEGYRLYQDLTVVRENHALLGTPLVVFVGYFPAGETDDWAKEAIRDPKVSVHWGEVTFVRHRRRKVRDFDERYLRERGLPAHQAWEGVIVVDAQGDAVRALEQPVSMTRLGLALREATRRESGAKAGSFEKAAPPSFRYALTDRIVVRDLDPADADLEVALKGSALRARISAQRFGPYDQRGELAVAEEIAALRHEAKQLGADVVEKNLRHQGLDVTLWSYRLKVPEARVRYRADALVARKGDIYTISLESASVEPSALRAKAAALLESLTILDDPTDEDPDTKGTGQ